MMRTLRMLVCGVLVTAAAPLQADYSEHPRAGELIRELSREGLYSEAELRAILRDARKNPKLIEAEQTAPEKTRTWPEYRGIFVKPERIKAGQRFLDDHADSLLRMHRDHGVPAELVTAIIGVETLYGAYTGPHRILDSLATQGFDHPSRTPFFFSELKEFLRLSKEKGWDPREPKGSYAGAMGMAQFMPSNYRRLALDFDADGEIDLWQPSDAIGSIANYLRHYVGRDQGWRRGEAVAYPVKIADTRNLVFNKKSATSQWKDLRPRLTGTLPKLSPDQPVGLIALDLGDGQTQHWLALPNFYAILSYNPRPYYAMAVWHLAEAIAGRETGRLP